jgi:hypothetical protein
MIDYECSKLLDKRKQAKLHLLQNPSQTNGDNLNNIRCETSRNFRKNWEYLKEKLMSLKQRVGTKMSETHKQAQLNLRRVTNLE